MSRLSERLLQLKIERNLLQKDIAKNVGLALRTYQYYESGERKPDSDVLLALADYFDVPLDYLVGQGIFADWDQILEHWDTVIDTIGKVYVSSSQKPEAFSKLIQAYSDFVKGDKIKIGVFLSMLVSKIEIKTESDGTVNISFQWKFE